MRMPTRAEGASEDFVLVRARPISLLVIAYEGVPITYYGYSRGAPLRNHPIKDIVQGK